MHINWLWLALGVGLLVVGVAFPRGKGGDGAQIRTVGISVFGAVTQSVRNIISPLPAAAGGSGSKDLRDWLSLLISFLGLMVSIIALFKGK